MDQVERISGTWRDDMSRQLRADDILGINRGLITAPAGCGKTQLIVETVKAHRGVPVLVLTHTNAGVAALRWRFVKEGVPASHYRLSTIDGWMLRLVSTFPKRAGLKIDPTKDFDYKLIRKHADIAIKDIPEEVFKGSYGRVLVDEYQDCSALQHRVLSDLADILPMCVFGDELQAIFGFNRQDPLADWNRDVEATFDLIGELTVPWRWINSGTPKLGEWILAARTQLLSGMSLTVRDEGNLVIWKKLKGTSSDEAEKINAFDELRKHGGSILVIGPSKSPNTQRQYARKMREACVIESVELTDLITFCQEMERATPAGLEEVVVKFIEACVTGFDISLVAARLADIRTEEDISGRWRSVLEILKAVEGSTGHREFRPMLYACMIKALDRFVQESESSLIHAACTIREYERYQGRRPTGRCVGSTLLLKGLEADHCLLLDRRDMDMNNLYVAISRGAKSLTIFY